MIKLLEAFEATWWPVLWPDGLGMAPTRPVARIVGVAISEAAMIARPFMNVRAIRLLRIARRHVGSMFNDVLTASAPLSLARSLARSHRC